MYESLAESIKEKARELGFDLCGIAPAEPSSFRPEFLDWLARDFHGEMGYMARDPERRLDPRRVMPDARSIVVVAMNYYTESAADTEDPSRAVFARYARNEDYHNVMTARLRELLAFIKEQAPTTEGPRATTRTATRTIADSPTQRPNDPTTLTEGRIYVDTGPILEREVAQRAGIGWFGKNTMLINTRRGSWFLLGEILLNLPLPPDSPAEGSCGTCTRCLDACPTGALIAPFQLDARRCISYLTIELKGPIPQEYHSHIGNRIFGCDICQECCPFNDRRAVATQEPAFLSREATTAPQLTSLVGMTEQDFRLKFKGSPVKRAKWQGLVRNVAVAMRVRQADHHGAGQPGDN